MLHSAALLPHAMEKVAGLVGPPVASMFSGAAELIKGGNGVTAGEAWAASVRESYPATSLAPEDLHILLELGDCLGTSSRDDQERHLRRTQDYLAICETRAREEKDSFCRVWQYLGLCTGLILVILLY